ncbi:hypothetical protein ABFU82_21985 [Nocardioides sp. WV_118_6]
MDKRAVDSRVRILHAAVATAPTYLTREQFASVAEVSLRTLDHHLAALRTDRLLDAGPARVLGSAFGYALVVAIRSQTSHAALIDPHGNVVHSVQGREVSNLRGLPPSDLLEHVQVLVRRLLATRTRGRGRSGPVDLIGIAVVLPSPLRQSGRPAGQSMHADWRNARRTKPLARAFAEALSAPVERVHVINDGHVHALATAHDRSRELTALGLQRPRESQGDESGPGYREGLSLTLHLGGVISAGVVLLAAERVAGRPGTRLGFVESRLLSGGHSMGGEIAHLPLSGQWFPTINQRSAHADVAPMDADRKCFCGALGHLQAHASDTAVAARVRHLDRRALHDVLLGDEIEDPDVAAALRDVGFLLGLVMMSPLKLLDPKAFHLTGLIARDETAAGVHDGLTERGWSGTLPEILLPPRGLAGQQHLGVRGAGLIVYREWAYRKFERIVRTGQTTGRRQDKADRPQPITFSYRYGAR